MLCLFFFPLATKPGSRCSRVPQRPGSAFHRNRIRGGPDRRPHSGHAVVLEARTVRSRQSCIRCRRYQRRPIEADGPFEVVEDTDESCCCCCARQMIRLPFPHEKRVVDAVGCDSHDDRKPYVAITVGVLIVTLSYDAAAKTMLVSSKLFCD